MRGSVATWTNPDVSINLPVLSPFKAAIITSLMPPVEAAGINLILILNSFISQGNWVIISPKLLQALSVELNYARSKTSTPWTAAANGIDFTGFHCC